MFTPTDIDQDNAGGNGSARSAVSKSGAINENRRREQHDILRRQAMVENGSLWPVDHKDVSNNLSLRKFVSLGAYYSQTLYKHEICANVHETRESL